MTARLFGGISSHAGPQAPLAGVLLDGSMPSGVAPVLILVLRRRR